MPDRESSSLAAWSRNAGAILLLGTAGALAGCASTTLPEPPAGLPAHEESQDDPYGCWAWVELARQTSTIRTGELVTTQQDSLYLLEGDSLRVFPATHVVRVGVIRYRGAAPIIERIAGWAEDRSMQLDRLRKYARFPQGMPPDIDRTKLHPRP